jgi:ectoine hydroxylase-related dioxygenase (phytanoyl-CoA dioxygenase family)
MTSHGFDPETLPWIDRPDADVDAYVDGLREPPSGDDLKEALRSWRRDGYLVLEQGVDVALVDAYLADLQRLLSERAQHEVFVDCASHGVTSIRELEPRDLEQPALRILDFHNASTAGKKLALAKRIVSFLRHVLQDQVVAMQSLTFLRGSQPLPHQDYAFVVAGIPSHLAAAWIALEDVHVDAGPVAYYPGSQRIPKFDFGNGIFFNEHSSLAEPEFAAHIEAECRKRGLASKTLSIKKGDVLIWHGGLAHWGTEVRDPSRTRLSLVVHYSSARAHTFDRRAPDRVPERQYWNGGFCYSDPIRPELENTFLAGGPLEEKRRWSLLDRWRSR